jgi:apolipoprotein N-acyltransferase
MSRRDLIRCLLSGLLWAAAFPPLGAFPLAWIAWVPLLGVVRERTPRRAFLPGFVAGGVAFLGVLHWIVVVVHVYGQAPLTFALFALLLLAAYLALFPAFWAVGVACARRAGTGAAVWLGAALWTALELLRGHAFTGFPWALAGYSQTPFLPLILVAEWTGVYGVSFLILLVNLGVAEAVHAVRTGSGRRRPLLHLALIAALVAAATGAGEARRRGIARRMREERPLRVALIQGNIPQGVKWSPDFVLASLQKHLALTADASASDPDLILWPEASVTYYFQEEEALDGLVFQAADAANAPIFFGASAREATGEGTRYYNSAFLVLPGGRVEGRYDKIHLVPFGEYVPFRRWLPFLSRVATGIAGGDFTPGASAEIFALDGRSFGALICYEAIFPALSRTLVRRGADFLVNITNDAWFGRSGAPGQHLQMAIFRAVENRIGMGRAANTGYSALIQPTGEVTVRTDLFTTVQRVGTLSPRVAETFYTQRGDVFAWGCAGLGVLAFLAGGRNRARRR